VSSFFVLLSAYTINSQITSYRATMCLFLVPKTRFHTVTRFSKKRKFWANSWRDLKLRLKKV